MQRKEFDQQLFLSVSVGKLFPDIVPFNVQNFGQKIIREFDLAREPEISDGGFFCIFRDYGI